MWDAQFLIFPEFPSHNIKCGSNTLGKKRDEKKKNGTVKKRPITNSNHFKTDEILVKTYKQVNVWHISTTLKFLY